MDMLSVGVRSHVVCLGPEDVHRQGFDETLAASPYPWWSIKTRQGFRLILSGVDGQDDPARPQTWDS